MTEYVTAQINDEELAAKWRRVAADYDGTKSDLIKDLIHDEFEFRGLDLDEDIPTNDDENEVPKIVEEYDPDSFERDLTVEEVDEILTHVDEPRLSREHVSRDNCKQGRHVDVVTAVSRYDLTSASKDDIRDLAEKMGWDTPYYLGNNKNQLDVPGKVLKRLGGSGKETEEVETDDTVERVEEILSEALRLAVYGESNEYMQAKSMREKVRELDEVLVHEMDLVDNANLVDVIVNMLYARETPVPDADVKAVETPSGVVEWYESNETDGWPEAYLEQQIEEFEGLVEEYVEVSEE